MQPTLWRNLSASPTARQLVHSMEPRASLATYNRLHTHHTRGMGNLVVPAHPRGRRPGREPLRRSPRTEVGLPHDLAGDQRHDALHWPAPMDSTLHRRDVEGEPSGKHRDARLVDVDDGVSDERAPTMAARVGRETSSEAPAEPLPRSSTRPAAGGGRIYEGWTPPRTVVTAAAAMPSSTSTESARRVSPHTSGPPDRLDRKR